MFTNTGLYGGPEQGPILAAARRMGLAGLGETDYGPLYESGGQSYTAGSSMGMPTTSDPASPWYTDKSLWTAINAEALFGVNLFRGATGQAPLPASQYAPQVAVGLNAETKQLVTFGLLGLGAFMLLGRKKRRK